MGGISKQLAARFRKAKKQLGNLRRQAAVDLAQVPRDVKSVEALIRSGHDPLHAAYLAAQNFASFFAEAMSQFPEGCGSPLAFTVDKNFNRRHMTEGQRTFLGAKLRALFEEEAQLRQRAGLNRVSEFPVVENSLQRRKHEEKRRSDEKAAQLRKVSDFSVRVADNISKQGVPALVDALAAGKVSLSAAAHIAKLRGAPFPRVCPSDSGVFRSAASSSRRWFRQGANANVRACLWAPPPPPWRLAARSFARSQVREAHGFVMRKVTRPIAAKPQPKLPILSAETSALSRNRLSRGGFCRRPSRLADPKRICAPCEDSKH
jgi:hypothetical protein